MTITYNRIPSALRVSATLVEADNSAARGGTAVQRTLVIGQMMSTGTATAATLVLVTSAAQAAVLFGSGSMLHRMFIAAFANDPTAEFWGIPLSDHGSGVAATGTLTMTGPATASGTLHLWVSGVYVPVTVTSGDTAAEVATAIAAAIEADDTLPVTAAVGGSGSEHIVTCTAKNDGTLGNNIDLRVNFGDGEATPAGVGVTIVAMASGATDVTLSTALDAMDDEPFAFIIQPYTDSSNLAALSSALNDVGGRWDPIRGLYGLSFTAAKAANLAAVTAVGDALNEPEYTVWGVVGSPTWSVEWAAALGCATARSLKRAPGASHGGVRVRGVVAPPMSSRLTLSERNTLLYHGIADWYALGRGLGRVYLGTTITTYQDDSAGNPDESWLLTQTRYLVALICQDAASTLAARFAEHALASDDTPVAPGLKVATPAKVKGYLAKRHDAWLAAGWCQSTTAGFLDRIIGPEINADTSTRLDVVIKPVLTQPLNQIAVSNTFLTSTPEV